MGRLKHALLLLMAVAPGVSFAQETPAAPGGGTTEAPKEAASEGVTKPTDVVTKPAEGITTTVEDPRIKKWADRFKGSVLIFDHSVSPETVFQGVQQSQLPSYQWWLSLRPRYYFRPDLSLRVRADLTLEWYNSADTTYYREAQFGDIWTDLVYSGIPKFGGIATSVGIRALWPTSKT